MAPPDDDRVLETDRDMTGQRSDGVGGVMRELKAQGAILLGFVALFWLVELVDQRVMGGRLELYGILPRTVVGLRGIVFAPFLHGDWAHVLANTVPFLGLGWLVMLRRRRDFWIVTAIAMAVGGGGVWLFAPARSLHIGASGLIFGYLGFLLLRGYFRRSLGAIALSLGVAATYGGLLWGVLPAQPGISWQGHLFGFLGGAIAARLLARPRDRPKP